MHTLKDAPQSLSRAPTPSIILDLGKLQKNCDRMLRRCRDVGARLRPHMKTLKSAEAAARARDPSHGGIAVATLNEAEYFASHGFTDIQYAVCISPDKLPLAERITARAPQFSFFVDSIAVARELVEFTSTRNVTLRAWLEIDCGEHRTGVSPEGMELIEIASILSSPNVRLAGVATHAGHSYRARTKAELCTIAEQETQAVRKAAQRLIAAGIKVGALSAGSTPTALNFTSASDLTEVRAGVYMAGDLFQAAIGSLSQDDIAISVLATVISHNTRLNQVVIDAGGLALSKDRSTAAVPEFDVGYGLALDMLGRPLGPKLTVGGVHQEHGEIRSEDPLLLERLPIGTRVRVLPNHVCMTAAMYDRYLVVDGSDKIIDTWGRTNGWS